MPETSPNSGGAILIAAISGRALAAAARRAGYRPLVADFFRDEDTVALAERAVKLPGDLGSGIDGRRAVATLEALAGGEQPVAVVCGSGFERQPEVIDEIARRFPLAGNGAASIRRVKHPESLAADCAALGIPHPEIRRDPPPDPENWLVKTAGGAGGSHVKRATSDAAEAGRYFQRIAPGRAVSALFLGDGRTARIVGFSRQWTSPAPGARFRYGGAVRLRRFDRGEGARIETWLTGLTRRAGLVGLCSADFVGGRGGYRLVEINPRPGATLDIFDSDEAPLIEAHLRAARGAPFRLPAFADCMAQLIAYARRPVAEFPVVSWPDWAADRQSKGARLAAGDPVCTVFAHGPSADAAWRQVRGNARQLRRHWEGDRA